MKRLGKFSQKSSDHFLMRDVKRRLLIQLAAANTFSLLVETHAHANMPIPEPLTLKERIKHTRWIFTGVLRRLVYMLPGTVEKLFTQGATIAPDELMLYERHDVAGPRTAFLEIDNAVPIMRQRDIGPKEVASVPVGTVYVHSGPTLVAEYRASISALEGKKVIFFIDAEEPRFGVNAISFPNPIYRPSSSGGNWRSGLPLPIEELPEVMRLGADLGLVQTNSEKR